MDDENPFFYYLYKFCAVKFLPSMKFEHEDIQSSNPIQYIIIFIHFDLFIQLHDIYFVYKSYIVIVIWIKEKSVFNIM